MEQSPSRKANISSASQEVPGILWNPEVRHRIQKSPPPAMAHPKVYTYRNSNPESSSPQPSRNIDCDIPDVFV